MAHRGPKNQARFREITTAITHLCDVLGEAIYESLARQDEATYYGRQCRITTPIHFYLLHKTVETISVALLLGRLGPG
jgi:hypothetical protein